MRAIRKECVRHRASTALAVETGEETLRARPALCAGWAAERSCRAIGTGDREAANRQRRAAGAPVACLERGLLPAAVASGRRSSVMERCVTLLGDAADGSPWHFVPR